MSIKFRMHRSSLEKSLETAFDVSSLSDLKNKIDEKNLYYTSCENLACKYYCYDGRIDWDTWIITENGNAIGFSDGELK